MTFHVGQKVVCVNAEYDHVNWRYVPNRPVLNGIYTVRAVVANWVDGCMPRLLLEEVVNGLDNWKGCECDSECAFLFFRFRPIVSRKTDISIFTKMLTPKRVDA